jgi:hypothetical protein
MDRKLHRCTQHHSSLYKHPIKVSEDFDKVVLYILYNHEHLSQSDKGIYETYVSPSEDVHDK